MVDDSGVSRPQRRSRPSGSRSKRGGDLFRPTTHSDKYGAVRGGACSEAHNAALLIWPSLGFCLSGDRFFSFPADTSGTAVVEVFGQCVGGCRIEEENFCKFLLFGVFPVLSLGICCNLLILLI